MANPWFRLYAEFVHDPKVQMLSEVMQRRLLMIFCLRCSNVLETLHETEIAFQLRITEEELKAAKLQFTEKGFINADWEVLNWEKRQFASDSSTARVSKHRAKAKEEGNATETLQHRSSNALDTDTDTDTEVKPLRSLKPRKQFADAGFDQFWAVYPKRRNRGDAETAWSKLKPNAGLLASILEAVEVAKRRDDWRKDGGQYVPYPATWLNAKGWADDAPTVTAGVPEYVRLGFGSVLEMIRSKEAA